MWNIHEYSYYSDSTMFDPLLVGMTQVHKYYITSLVTRNGTRCKTAISTGTKQPSLNNQAKETKLKRPS